MLSEMLIAYNFETSVVHEEQELLSRDGDIEGMCVPSAKQDIGVNVQYVTLRENVALLSEVISDSPKMQEDSKETSALENTEELDVHIVLRVL